MGTTIKKTIIKMLLSILENVIFVVKFIVIQIHFHLNILCIFSPSKTIKKIDKSMHKCFPFNREFSKSPIDRCRGLRSTVMQPFKSRVQHNIHLFASENSDAADTNPMRHGMKQPLFGCTKSVTDRKEGQGIARQDRSDVF